MKFGGGGGYLCGSFLQRGAWNATRCKHICRDKCCKEMPPLLLIECSLEHLCARVRWLLQQRGEEARWVGAAFLLV